MLQDRHGALAISILRMKGQNLLRVISSMRLRRTQSICPGLIRPSLALDPESYFAAIRAQQLGIDASEFRSELHNALLQLYEYLGKYPEVEIRLYDDFPTQICFIIDEDIYNCVVSKYQQSRNNCLFKLDGQYPVLHTSFILHFISVWRDTKTTKRYFPRGHRIIPLEGNA